MIPVQWWDRGSWRWRGIGRDRGRCGPGSLWKIGAGRANSNRTFRWGSSRALGGIAEVKNLGSELELESSVGTEIFLGSRVLTLHGAWPLLNYARRTGQRFLVGYLP